MKRLIPLLAAAFCCGLLFGCGSIEHKRPVLLDGGVVAYESETAKGFLTKAAIENASSHTKDGTYSHSFGVKGANVSGDVEMLREIRGMMKDAGELGLQGAGKAATGGLAP